VSLVPVVHPRVSGHASPVTPADRRPDARIAARILWMLATVLVVWLAIMGTAHAAAASDPSAALVRKYAPVLRLKDVPGSCDIGKPYVPIDVNLLMNNREVALRGPWDTTNIVTVGPSAHELAQGLWGYHLDFPGNSLRPGCTYEEWQQRLLTGSAPEMYGRVVTQAGFPGRLAVQYWFFYVYNGWINTHEGDWEMIQLNFDAATPQAALTGRPTDVGYSQHSSAERATWGAAPLETVAGTHPVVYPALGSNANFFTSDLFLMRSSAEGVGCDDTTGPSTTITPKVAVVPTATDAYLRAYPWLGFDGRWGEKQAAFFNGPTGPNEKLQWTEPFTWASDYWRDQSFAVPAARVIPTPATDLFCGAVARGSVVLRQVKANPLPWLVGLGVAALILMWGIGKTTWRPSDPRPLVGRRPLGRVISAGTARFWSRRRLFLGIGLVFVPIGIVVALVQAFAFNIWGLTPLIGDTGRSNGFVGGLALLFGLVVTFLGLAIVQAATSRAVRDLDAGRPVGPVSAYRGLRGRLRDLVLALVVMVVVQIVLDLTVVLIPVAIYLLVRWSLLGVVAGLEDDPQPGVLRRSAVLTRRHWWRTAVVAVGVTGLALLVGPLIGGLVLIATSASFAFVNVIAAVVNVAALPFASVVLTYLYYDLVDREGADATTTVAPADGD
jgi:hypothetical protein